MREKALGALAALGCDDANQLDMWQTSALVAAVLAGAAGTHIGMQPPLDRVAGGTR